MAHLDKKKYPTHMDPGASGDTTVRLGQYEERRKESKFRQEPDQEINIYPEKKKPRGGAPDWMKILAAGAVGYAATKFAGDYIDPSLISGAISEGTAGYMKGQEQKRTRERQEVQGKRTRRRQDEGDIRASESHKMRTNEYNARMDRVAKELLEPKNKPPTAGQTNDAWRFGREYYVDPADNLWKTKDMEKIEDWQQKNRDITDRREKAGIMGSKKEPKDLKREKIIRLSELKKSSGYDELSPAEKVQKENELGKITEQEYWASMDPHANFSLHQKGMGTQQPGQPGIQSAPGAPGQAPAAGPGGQVMDPDERAVMMIEQAGLMLEPELRDKLMGSRYLKEDLVLRQKILDIYTKRFPRGPQTATPERIRPSISGAVSAPPSKDQPDSKLKGKNRTHRIR